MVGNDKNIPQMVVKNGDEYNTMVESVKRHLKQKQKEIGAEKHFNTTWLCNMFFSIQIMVC